MLSGSGNDVELAFLSVESEALGDMISVGVATRNSMN